MSRLVDRLRGGSGERSIYSIDDYAAAVAQSMQGLEMSWGSTKAPTLEERNASFNNSVVFSVMAVRQFVFSAVRFRYQRLRDGKPSDLFGNPALGILETPWTGGTTQDLLSRMIQDADLEGNSYQVRDTPLSRLGASDSAEIVRLRPDWVKVVTTPRLVDRSRGPMGHRKVGYVYCEGGFSSGNEPVPLLLDEVAHFMPTPDPLHPFRGMSWLTPVIREVENDLLMNQHKRKFFENGATPNMVIKHAEGADRDAILKFNERLQAENAGVGNAYKTLNLYPGADVTLAGADMKQIDFKQVQAAGETRIAAAGGTPPIIVGLSEGLEAATYSNYGQARRRFADGTMHPLWQNAAGSLAPLVPPPGPDARLWYDADDVPFLREDEKDASEITQIRATTIRTLVDGGYTPESSAKAVETGDFRLLRHTGLFSVQLQKPGADGAHPGEVTS